MSRQSVALIINGVPESPWKNGSTQQPLMMALALEKSGFRVDFFAESQSVYYDYVAQPLAKLFSSKGIPYMAVLMVTHIKAFGPSRDLLDLSKNTKLVHVLCGHHALFTVEDLVFKQNRCADMLVNAYANETWIFGMHADFSSCYEHWLNTPVKVYPYVWSPVVVEAYLRENKLTPSKVRAQPHLPLTIVIAEPSLNTIKTCFLPLVAINSYVRKYPGRVRRVIVLCKPSGPGFDALRRYLGDIANMLELHDRLIWTGVACQLLDRENTVPVLLSHQMHNEANFLHLETIYLGIPIVHNSACFRPAGFYYDAWNVHALHAQLDQVWNGARNDALSRSILGRYLPENEEVVQGFKSLLTTQAQA